MTRSTSVDSCKVSSPPYPCRAATEWGRVSRYRAVAQVLTQSEQLAHFEPWPIDRLTETDMNWIAVGAINWVAVGAIAETIGGLGVLVSLVYVAIQIRQNSHLIARSVQSDELAAFERNIESGNGIRELMILHPSLAQLFLKGSKSFGSLDTAPRLDRLSTSPLRPLASHNSLSSLERPRARSRRRRSRIARASRCAARLAAK